MQFRKGTRPDPHPPDEATARALLPLPSGPLFPSPQRPRPPTPLCILRFLPTFALYVNGIAEHVLFCVWLLWTSMPRIYFYL